MIQQRALAYTNPELIAEPTIEESRIDARVGDIRLITMLIGGLIGAGVAARNYPANLDERNQWLIYALVAALLGLVAGESFGFGLSRWSEVKQYHTLRRLRIWFSVLFVLAIAAGLVAATPLVLGESADTTATDNLTLNGVLFASLAVLGGLPIAATLAAIKQVVMDPLPGTTGQQLDALLRLRRIASRILSQLGVLVLLVMAVNAASWNWGVEQDPNVVIFSGAVASLLVGMMYVPTASSLRRRSAIFVERNYPLTNVVSGQLITAADDRLKLERMLGLDQTTFGELKAGLVVLTPVVIGVLASLVPKF